MNAVVAILVLVVVALALVVMATGRVSRAAVVVTAGVLLVVLRLVATDDLTGERRVGVSWNVVLVIVGVIGLGALLGDLSRSRRTRQKDHDRAA